MIKITKDIENFNLIIRVVELVNEQKEPVKIGLLYNEYLKERNGMGASYKTFQRVIQELAERELIYIKKIIGGSYGTTTLLSDKPFKEVD